MQKTRKNMYTGDEVDRDKQAQTRADKNSNRRTQMQTNRYAGGGRDRQTDLQTPSRDTLMQMDE